ncbi:hypothetical protein DB345_19850 [Spartobacteria bacterium LR76]|nr:hypothetical protein DB345_19850 [Spartobacteria bacterium LR76]
MGYFLQAIISTIPVLKARYSDFKSAVVVPLTDDFALIPITDELLDEVGASGSSGKFYRYTPEVANWVRAISTYGAVAYIEAEFFGGTGGQIAVVWSSGDEILPPTQETGAINIALQLLGVSRGSSLDEFEAVGLPRHRDTDDWIDDALPRQ